MRSRWLRFVLAGLLTSVVLFAVTLALPVESWRRGEPAGPPLHATVPPPSWPRPLRVWVDTDAACGHGEGTDPDDCFALLLLARSPEVAVQGISSVFGNASLEITDSITRALAMQLSSERHLPVARGAAEPWDERPGDDSAAQSPAYRALAGALARGPLVVLALGPLTNVALLLRERPELRSRVMRVVAVMGRRRGHLFHPVEGGTGSSFFGHGPVFRDFNFAKDEEAVSALLDMEVPLTLIPYEAAREIQVTRADLERLGNTGGANTWVATRAQGWLEYWEKEIGRAGFFPFDLVAAGYVVRPELAQCRAVTARVGKDPGLLGWLGQRGLFVRGRESPPGGGHSKPPVHYCPDLAPSAGTWLKTQLISSHPSPVLLRHRGLH